ncbi:SDR family oxidoreductase [bacterium]|nr:SDR family oxidoreductase [candidate division CSSED10-310 bacterium]
MIRYLVTGAAGFIGSHLVESLLTLPNTEIIAIDNLITGNLNNLKHLLNRIHFIQDDITHPDVLKELMENIDFVLHQAALPSVPRSISDPDACNRHNITGTLQVLIAARDARVKRVIFASSSSVYGSDITLPKHESLPTIPKSPYALTKLTGEHYCRIFYEAYGLETVALRYFNVFGPRQNVASQYSAVIPQFISHLLAGTPPEIHGDGTQSRDFTYISNIVMANLQACTAPGIAGQVFNVGCGSHISINDLYSIIADEIGSDLEPIYTPPRIGDVRHSCADITKARNLIGYDPSVSVREGLAITVDHYANVFR